MTASATHGRAQGRRFPAADPLASRRFTRRQAGPCAFTLRTLLAGVLAGSLGFAAHHALPFQSHAVEAVIFVVVGAVVVAVAAARVALRREVPAPAPVVVLSAGATAVHPAAHDDLGFCIALHHAELEHGFFTKLGPRFLEAYHATFVDSPHAVSRVATIGGHPVGFVAGLLQPRAHAFN
jgi:hypothetical protein